MPEQSTDVLLRLERDGLLRREGERYRTTRRWQSAMARAAFRLLSSDGDGDDVRVPIAAALVAIYADAGLSTEELAARVEAMLPIELFELAPLVRAG